jgi:formylglycine-generating enzyme required for sulfatase activity
MLLGLMVALAQLGDAKGQEGKGKDDALIAAMKFVKVPKGTFWMGWDSVTKTSKQVEIRRDFELAAYTVTQEQWDAVMGAGSNPSWFSRQGKGKDQVKDVSEADLKRFPVERVSWDEVQVFVKKLNEREQGKGWRYRLPKEAEWEYACRGGATTKEEC